MPWDMPKHEDTATSSKQKSPNEELLCEFHEQERKRKRKRGKRRVQEQQCEGKIEVVFDSLIEANKCVQLE